MAEKKPESFFIKYMLSCASAAVAETGMFKACIGNSLIKIFMKYLFI